MHRYCIYIYIYTYTHRIYMSYVKGSLVGSDVRTFVFLDKSFTALANKGVHADDALSPDFFLSLLLLHLLQLPTIWSVSETVWLSFQFWAEAFGTPVAGIGGWPRFLFLFMCLFFLATLRIFCVEVIYKEVQNCEVRAKHVSIV